MAKICALSDLHGVLPKIEECELVLIGGDIVPLEYQTSKADSTTWLITTFLDWIKSLPCERVIMVAGNHDLILDYASFLGDVLTNITDNKLIYLEGNVYNYLTLGGNNISIYGSPYCHRFGHWAFMESEAWLSGYYDNIPNNVTIVLSHDTPAIGDLDLLPPSKWSPKPTHAGGISLANVIEKAKPKYVFCGHLHTCKDKYLETENTKIYNVSILNNEYKNVYEPTYVNIDEEQKHLI